MNNIESARKRKKLSQAELARQIKASRSHVCALEGNRVNASPGLAKKISAVLDIPPNAVIYPNEPYVTQTNKENQHE